MRLSKQSPEHNLQIYNLNTESKPVEENERKNEENM